MSFDWVSASLGFVVGLIVGFGAWIASTNRRRADAQVIGVAPSFGAAAVQMPYASAPIAGDDPQARRIEALEAENELFRHRAAQVDLLQTEIASLRVALARGTGADPFERIRGIGSVFAQKLHAAGFLTFDQLSHATVEELREIIQPEEWQRVNFDAWKQEAKEWADGVRQVASRR